jgi:hypothetical protein
MSKVYGDEETITSKSTGSLQKGQWKSRQAFSSLPIEMPMFFREKNFY